MPLPTSERPVTLPLPSNPASRQHEATDQIAAGAQHEQRLLPVDDLRRAVRR